MTRLLDREHSILTQKLSFGGLPPHKPVFFLKDLAIHLGIPVKRMNQWYHFADMVIYRPPRVEDGPLRGDWHEIAPKQWVFRQSTRQELNRPRMASYRPAKTPGARRKHYRVSPYMAAKIIIAVRALQGRAIQEPELFTRQDKHLVTRRPDAEANKICGLMRRSS